MRGSIQQRGRRSWRLRFDLVRDVGAGKRRMQEVTFRGSRREAENKLHDLLASVTKGTYVEPCRITLRQFLEDRLKHWEASGSITLRTLQRYRELVNDQIIPHLGEKMLQRLRPLEIEWWHGVLRTSGRKNKKGGISPRTIGHAHRVLRKALAEAARNDLIFRNVAAIQTPPAIGGTEIAILSAEDVTSVVTKLRGRRGHREFVTALFTGMRLGELLALKWGAVDLDRKAISVREALEKTKAAGIRFKDPKTRAGRREITLPDVVLDVLRAQRRDALELRMALGLGKLPDDALVFPAADGAPRAPQSLSKAWKRAAEDHIATRGVTFHALRHTHASQLIEAGVDIVTISRRLGHASPNVTLAIYAHLFRQRDDKAADAINAAMGGCRS